MGKKAKEIKELLGLDGLADWLHQNRKDWKADLLSQDRSGTATALRIQFVDGSSIEMGK